MIKLEDVCHISSGGTPSRSNLKFYGGDVLWAKISDIENAKNGILTDTEEKITEEGLRSIGNRIFPRGTLLFAMYGSIGKVAITGSEMATNQAILGIRPKNKDEIYLPFLKIWFEQNRQKLINQGRGVALQNLSATIVRNLKIHLPPLPDQIRIATVLIKAEALIAQRKESICLLDELVKSTFLEMFGDPASMKKQKMDRLGDYIDFLTSGSRGWAQYYSDRGAKFLRIQNVGKGILNLEDITFVQVPNSAEAERTRVREGDLLISITADLGRTSVIPKDFGEAYINQHLALVRLNPVLNSVYTAFFYVMPFGNSEIQKKNRAAVKAGLNFNDIKGFPIYIPDYASQIQFAQIVEKVESLKMQYQASLEELENLYRSLSQRAFKGQLNLSNLLIEDTLEPFIKLTEKPIEVIVEDQNTVPLEDTGISAGEIPGQYSSREVYIHFYESFLKKHFSETILKPNEVENRFNATYDPEKITFNYDIFRAVIFKALKEKKPFLRQSFDEEKKQITLQLFSDEIAKA